jgi:gas vesicle protein
MNVRQPWFVAGFLCGAIVSGAAVLLSTPLSGRDLRQAVIDHFKRAQDEARAAGREAEAEVLTRYRQFRGPSADPGESPSPALASPAT